MTMLRLTVKEKERWQRVAEQLEIPASQLMRLSMKIGLPKSRRQLAEKEV